MKARINKDRCKGCGLCIIHCPLKSLELSSQLNKRGVKFARLKQGAKCTGCGLCFIMCPDTCIKITKEEKSEK